MPERAQGPRDVLLIRPRKGWTGIDLRELWTYRELLYFLVWRDLKVRYKQTVFGAFWAVIQPVMLMIVFTVFLGRLTGIAPAGVPYPVFAFVALVPWTLFAQSLSGASSSLVDASNLLQKVYFPRILLPVGAIASYLLDFAIALAVLGLLLVGSGIPITVSIGWVLPLTALLLEVALAVGVCLAAINVRYRDVRHALPFLAQLWLFASPVAYATSLVPSEWQPIYRLNPMTGVIEGFRWALLGQGDPPVASVAISVVVASALLAVGIAYFRRVERTFADVI